MPKNPMAEIAREVKIRARVSCVYPDGSLKVIIAVKDGERAFVIDGSSVVAEPVSAPGGPPQDEPTPQPYPPDPEV